VHLCRWGLHHWRFAELPEEEWSPAVRYTINGQTSTAVMVRRCGRCRLAQVVAFEPGSGIASDYEWVVEDVRVPDRVNHLFPDH
jgi:hypothetical protein